jgi:CBS domain-containing protein
LPLVGVWIVDFVFKLNADTVAEAMSAPPQCVEPHLSVRAVFAQLREHRTGGVIVCRDGRLAGIFTERDALKLMAAGANLDGPIETVMVANPVAVRASDNIASAIRTMSVGGYRRLPVVDGQNRPVGMVNVADIVHYLCEYFPQAVYNLPPEPQVVMHARDGA